MWMKQNLASVSSLSMFFLAAWVLAHPLLTALNLWYACGHAFADMHLHVYYCHC